MYLFLRVNHYLIRAKKIGAEKIKAFYCFLISVTLISPEIYLKSLFSSFIKYRQSLPVDIRENYPKM